MTSPEDIFRQQVVTLLSRCNNDVPTLLKSISRSLNECGRSDVRVDVDGTGTVVTVAQSPYHAKAHHSTFQQVIDQLVSDAKRQLTAIVPPKSTAERKNPLTSPSSSRTASPSTVPSKELSSASPTGSVPSAVRQASPTTVDRAAVPRTDTKASSSPVTDSAATKPSAQPSSRSASPDKLKKLRKSFPSKSKKPEWPTSQYNGNYLLFRYGGKYPEHARYGFYRRYGNEGRGAATSEFHNLPAGEYPDRTLAGMS